MIDRRLLSVSEVAERVGLSEKAIRRAIDDSELCASKLRARIRIDPVDLAAWIEQSRVTPRSAPIGRSRSAPAENGLRVLLGAGERQES